MNILHVISVAASGGAEVYVKDLAKYLSEQGHTLHIAFLSSAADDNRDLSYEQDFLGDLLSSNVKTYIIGNETRKKPWLGILRLRKYIKKNKIDICHTHLAYGIVFSTLSKVPVVFTYHQLTPRWNKLTYKIFNNLVDEYVGISEKCAVALSTYTGQKVNTIANAVSEAKFDGYVRKRTLEPIVHIAMVGRLVCQKGYMTMLQALTLLDKDILERLRISIAGEGDAQYKNDLLNFIRHNNLSSIVEFIGVVRNIPEFLYKADIFLMSSWFEGLPIALTEAAISGLPCIVTDVGGCSEVIIKSKNGVAVPAENPQKIAEEITRFVLSKTLIEEYSTNAIDNAHKYSISKAAQLHLDLYNSILK